MGTLIITKFSAHFEDLRTARLVWQGDVDELVQATGTQDGRVDDVGPVGGTDDEHVLLGTHAVHLRQDLVDDAVGGASWKVVHEKHFTLGTIHRHSPASPMLPPRDLATESSSSKKRTHGAAALAYRTGCNLDKARQCSRRRHLVEHVAHVRLRFAEPHGEQLGALDADKVGLALVRDRLGQQGFATAWRAVEEHAARWFHTEL